MLRYSKQLLCPFADKVISLASLGTILEKCSLNVSGISDGVVIEIYAFTISSFTDEVHVSVKSCKFIECLLAGSSRVIFVFIK